MFKFHLITQNFTSTPSHPNPIMSHNFSMSDISNTNGAGDAENVAKVNAINLSHDHNFTFRTK